MKKVEILHLDYMFVDTNEIDLRAIFPMIRNIQISDYYFSRPSIIEQNFPHLEEMIVESSLKSDSMQLRRRLQLNPQIRNLRVEEGNWIGLRIINERLPQLERFELVRINDNPPIEGNNIHFQNMKYFHLWTLPNDLQRFGITFRNLEEIKCFGENYNQCFNIIIQNKQLKKVDCWLLNVEQFQQIVAELPNLEEIRLKYDATSDDAIVQFIETGKQLKKIIFCNSSIQNYNQIRQRLQYKWEISQERNGFYTVFTRID